MIAVFLPRIAACRPGVEEIGPVDVDQGEAVGAQVESGTEVALLSIALDAGDGDDMVLAGDLTGGGSHNDCLVEAGEDILVRVDPVGASYRIGPRASHLDHPILPSTP